MKVPNRSSIYPYLRLLWCASALVQFEPELALAESKPSTPTASVSTPSPAGQASSPAVSSTVSGVRVQSDDTCCQPRRKPLRMLDKSWLLLQAESNLARWKDRTVGVVAEWVPLVSDKHALWFGLLGGGAYDYRAEHKTRALIGGEFGYAWISWSNGLTYDWRWTHLGLGWRTRLSFVLPYELSSEESHPDCCGPRDCSDPMWKSEYRVMNCTCDRLIRALFLRPYFQLDYYTDSSYTANAPHNWFPTFGVAVGYAHGWGG